MRVCWQRWNYYGHIRPCWLKISEEIQVPALLCLDPCVCESWARQQGGSSEEGDGHRDECKTPCYFPPAKIFKAAEVTMLPSIVGLSSAPRPQSLSLSDSFIRSQLPTMQQIECYYICPKDRGGLSVWDLSGWWHCHQSLATLMAEHLKLGSTLCPGEDKSLEEKNLKV